MKNRKKQQQEKPVISKADQDMINELDYEYKKAHKAEKLQELKDTLAKLKDYKKRFKAEGRDDMVEEIDKDIVATQKELDELDK